MIIFYTFILKIHLIGDWKESWDWKPWDWKEFDNFRDSEV